MRAGSVNGEPLRPGTEGWPSSRKRQGRSTPTRMPIRGPRAIRNTPRRAGRSEIQSGPRVRSSRSWATSVGSATQSLDERIWDPVVQSDDNLATVWVKYEFLAGGQFSHCGVDAFQLFKSPTGWKIFQVSDTQRRDACWHKP